MENNAKAESVTRGHGLLEGFLARKRAAMADKLIPDSHRHGRILDIGCGTTPYFLAHTYFQEKFGIDPVLGELREEKGLHLQRFDVEEGKPLPFQNDFFEVVSMLAVFEHIKQDVLSTFLSEVHRVLKPGGMLVLTTPCSWSDGILKVLAQTGMVSKEEIYEHEGAYNHQNITEFLEKGGFKKEHVTLGYFELFLNNWGTARK